MGAPPLRIALVTHRFVRGDGQGRVNYELARALLASGHEVWLVASEVAPDLAQAPGAHPVLLGCGPLPTELLRNQWFAARTTRWLWRHRRRLDLVHASGFVSWARADISSCHFVHSAWIRSPFHTWQVRRDAYGLYQLLYTWANRGFEKVAYRRARLVVAVSEQVRTELTEVAGISPDRVRVIQNGVDVDEFTPCTPTPDTGIRPGRVALFIGDIRTPRKNLDTLLRAIALVDRVTLLVVGATEGSPYPRQAEALGLAERVHFLGFRRDVAALMGIADVFVFPSRYEACSLVLLEAASAGLPVIAGRHTGGTELLNPACSVLLEDPNDEQELAGALAALFDDPPRLRLMGAAARQVAVANSWGRMAQRYLDLYREVCDPDCAARVARRIPAA